MSPSIPRFHVSTETVQDLQIYELQDGTPSRPCRRRRGQQNSDLLVESLQEVLAFFGGTHYAKTTALS